MDPPSPPDHPQGPSPKRKRPAADRRIAIACQPCRQRRSKCDGQRPCSVCASRSDSECTYQHSDRRVWISQATYLGLLEERDELKRRCKEMEQSLAAMSVAEKGPPLNPITPTSVETRLNADEHPHEDDLEDDEDDAAMATGRLLTDERGVARYMGDSSGAAFYSALMELLALVLPPERSVTGPHASTSYHTWDSRPLPLTRANPFILPPVHLARQLVSIFLQHCSDIFHFVAPDAFKADVDAMYATGGTFQPQGSAEVWRLAQFYLVLALGTLHTHSSPLDRAAGNEEGDSSFPGIDYFARSNVLLVGFAEHSSLDAVKALALAAYYLLSVCHRDAAYAYIGAAMRTAISLGMHRMTSRRDDEHTKLVFWTVYILDRLISSTLGRPVQVLDDEISTPKPFAPNPKLRAVGLAAHVHIGQLQTGIVRDLYVTSSRDKSRRLFSVSAAVKLYSAGVAVAQELQQSDYVFTNPRAEVLLKLACNQTLNVICRHAMLHALRMRWRQGNAYAFDLLAESPITINASGELERNLARLCTDTVATALDSAHLMQVLYATGMCLPWCFFDSHCAYNAGVVLLLSKLVDPRPVDDEVATTKSVLATLASCGNESAQSCKSILDTLTLAIEQVPTVIPPMDDALVMPDAPQSTNEWVELLQSLGMSV